MKKLNYKKVTERICKFLRVEFKKRKKTKAVLALSGGIDSTLCAYLCKRAGLDLYTIILPYRNKGLDGKVVAQTLNLPKSRIITVNIGSFVDEAVKEIQKTIKIDYVDRGNIMARQRMIVQYAIARKLGGLVVGTENLSEYYLGYFTLYGDQACDISPISGLFKTQVRELAEYLKVPKSFVEKTPSAGLWQGQTDEGEFGFTYKDADEILYLFLIKKYLVQKIIKKGFSKKLINKVLARMKATDFKRQSPPKLLLD